MVGQILVASDPLSHYLVSVCLLIELLMANSFLQGKEVLYLTAFKSREGRSHVAHSVIKQLQKQTLTATYYLLSLPHAHLANTFPLEPLWFQWTCQG